jgi:hypothetical protein
LASRRLCEEKEGGDAKEEGADVEYDEDVLRQDLR